MRDGSGCSVIYVWLILLVSTLFSPPSLVQTAISRSQDSECGVEDDRCILLQFKNGLRNHGGERLRSWNNSSAAASWSGVIWQTREDGYMYVEKLELREFGLQGDIYPLLHRGLVLLSELDVSSNNLSGSLPSTLRICSRLTALNLSGNSLQGQIPTDVQCEQSGNVSTQVVMDLALSLRNLSLADNEISGEIPGSFISALPSLQVLDLSDNNLTGRIPSEIGKLSNLTTLLLRDNSFYGSIPSSLASSSEMVELILGNNKFSGTIPLDIFASLPKIEFLDVSFNQFVGELQFSPGGRHFKHLRSLLLSGNLLNGSVPDLLGNLANLEVLELKSNNFTGQVPSSLGRLPRLRSLNLQKNNLTGSIPAELGQLSSLSALNLGVNKLSGEIPASLGNCSNLRSLWLHQNVLTGFIPVQLYHLTDLVVLSLFDNKLNGTIAPEIRNLSRLVVLDYSWNLLRESIAKEVCELTRIRILLLNNNKLAGPLPVCIWNFPALQISDFSYNSLSGQIPGNFTGLSILRVRNRTKKLTVPAELRLTSYDQKIMDLRLSWKAEESPNLIILSNNQFIGEIPAGFGELQNMQELDLSFNNLSGPIPPALGYASQLFLLNLANNQLNGSMPPLLINLTFLSRLNVSNNQLVGPIPQGYQFATFTNTSYAGNPGLCGYPMTIQCNDIAASPDAEAVLSSRASREMSKKYLLLCIIGSSALAVVSLIVILSIWTCIGRCWRRRSSLVSHSCDLFDNKDDLQFLLPSLTPKELAIATDYYNDNNIIGDGGFGLVYKAVLINGSVVAVKKLVEDGMQGQSEFLAEMRTLGKLKHKNLVCLLGYCSYGRERILVYEYLKHGSLDSWLHCRDEGVPGLDWRTRLKIARGAAEGLAFLHHDCRPAIIHRDIKVSNILLDGEFESRLADFGLARSARALESHVSTELAGTAGYIPPEYSQATSATLKGDVYSFGVVLLEIITGKRPTDPFYKKKDMAHVVNYIQDMAWRDEALDKSLAYSCNEQMVEFMRIAGLCCQPCPSKRPRMNQVVRILELLERQCHSRNPSVVFYDEEGISSPRCR